MREIILWRSREIHYAAAGRAEVSRATHDDFARNVCTKIERKACEMCKTLRMEECAVLSSFRCESGKESSARGSSCRGTSTRRMCKVKMLVFICGADLGQQKTGARCFCLRFAGREIRFVQTSRLNRTNTGEMSVNCIRCARVPSTCERASTSYSAAKKLFIFIENLSGAI